MNTPPPDTRQGGRMMQVTEAQIRWALWHARSGNVRDDYIVNGLKAGLGKDWASDDESDEADVIEHVRLLKEDGNG